MRNFFNPSSKVYNAPERIKLSRDNDLDFLRLLLACCVVFYHSKTILGGLDFTFARISAVPIFLVLSGLLVTESFYGSANIFKYVEKRVRRIYPAYLAVVIFGGLIAYFGWNALGDSQAKLPDLFKYWGINASFANWIAPCVVEATSTQNMCEVNGSLWVMKWEVVFYALLPVLLIALSRFPKWILCIILVGLTARVSVEPSPYLRIFQCFIIGITLFYLKPYWVPLRERLPTIPSVLRLVLLIGSFFLARHMPYGIFILLILFISFYPSSGWRPNFLKFGDISYGIFLIHFPLMTGIFQFLPETIFGPWVSFVVLAISIVLSIVLYWVVEKPFLLPSSHYRTPKASTSTS